jgi:hypothetical protein
MGGFDTLLAKTAFRKTATNGFVSYLRIVIQKSRFSRAKSICRLDAHDLQYNLLLNIITTSKDQYS